MLTKEQLSQVRKYTRMATNVRPSQRTYSKRTGIPQSTLSRLLSERKAGTSTRHLRVADKKVREKCVELREDSARRGDHSVVTSKQVSEEIQWETLTGEKFKTASRVKKALKNRKGLRDPACSRTHGHKILAIRRKIDNANHCR
eukprot:GILI01025272.1.p1 GENE.GILI01025272.1~~GILI01025272.1.p1  ORF type:complete len:144 (+),score=17.73 GILI01025272.1:67-498(+)